MTRKEFIGVYNVGYRDGKIEDYCPNDYDDIFDIEQEPKTERIEYGTDGNSYKPTISNGKELEQEPCDDAINRILKRMWNCRGKHTTSIDKVKMEQIIRDELNPQNDVLDKIKTDIEQYQADCDLSCSDDGNCKTCNNITFGSIYRIIDKYKNEMLK